MRLRLVHLLPITLTLMLVGASCNSSKEPLPPGPPGDMPPPVGPSNRSDASPSLADAGTDGASSDAQAADGGLRGDASPQE